jgi:hypothetical protein
MVARAMNDYFSRVWVEGDPPLVGGNPPVEPVPDQEPRPTRPPSRRALRLIVSGGVAAIVFVAWWVIAGPLAWPPAVPEVTLGITLAVLYALICEAIGGKP